VTNRSIPKMEMPTVKMARYAPARVRPARIRSGSSGLAILACKTAKAASRTVPAASAPSVTGLVQAAVSAWEKP
jgi:hypothetical protein